MLITSWVTDRKMDVETWTREKLFQHAVSNTFLGKAAQKTANTELAGVMERCPYYDNIYLADRHGELAAASDNRAVGKVNIINRDSFKKSMKGETVVSKVIKSWDTGSLVFIISGPILVEDEVQGFLLGAVNLTKCCKSEFTD